MTLQSRRIIYISAIIVFLIIAPLLIAVALGVRIDPETGSLIQTGGIYIKTFPNNAQVTLGTTQTTRSPHEFRYLRPGIYTAQIHAEGYTNVTFDIPVLQRTATRIDPIELLKENPDSSQSFSSVNFVSLSPFSASELYAQQSEQENNITLYDGSKFFTLQTPATTPFTSALWNTKKNQVLLFAGSDMFWIDIDDRNIIGPISNITRAQFTDSTSTIRVETQKLILELNLKTQETIQLDASLFKKTQSQSILTTESQNGLENIVYYPQGNLSEKHTLRSVSQVVSFTDVGEQNVLMQTKDGLFIFNFETQSLMLLSDTAFSWTIAGTKLYFATTFEIWSYDLETTTISFINRFGSPISTFSISPRASALFVANSDKLTTWYLTTPYPVAIEKTFPENTTILPHRISRDVFHFINLSETITTIEQYSL